MNKSIASSSSARSKVSAGQSAQAAQPALLFAVAGSLPAVAVATDVGLPLLILLVVVEMVLIGTAAAMLRAQRPGAVGGSLVTGAFAPPPGPRDAAVLDALEPLRDLDREVAER
ncbi:hypothetical protein [Allostreptomyces psammosilenae]|uniref:Uncharacterized protein n=1 Tax=Allostreptomyces psammosilenae TaxID=1892865 RepID=A0A853A4Z8_9ACTN|nr:hypothetical protein [Allostreptomyces psammosilenae]NYI05771.1 hypothetical protein [Allostreptomyces psammosilenae]